MITAEYAIDTIKSRLIQLIDSGQLNAKYNDIDDSISFYVNKIDIGIAVPLLTLRISDHHPKLKHYTDGHREPWKSYNISIEFYEPKYDSDGEVQQNPFKRRVQVPLNSDANYFTVIAYEYKPQNLETEDVDAIYNAIMEYVQGDGYTDPFINDRLKKAKRYIRTSILKFRRDNSYGRWFSEINAERNKQDGWGNATQAEINWWKNKNIGENKDIKQYTNMSKKMIRLTESDLHKIVKESVNRIINEIGDTEKGQRALGALTAARFKGKKKGDWGEVSKKSSDEIEKASNKAAKSGYNENEPWSSLMAWHKKRASMAGAYNDGYQKQVNESGFYPMEYDSKMGYYTPNGTVDGVDTYIDFDEMSFSELKALRDKYLEQVGHTPWNKIANARPDIFHAVNAIEEELEDRRERYREGDKSALS